MREIRLFVEHPLQPGLEVSLPDDSAQHALRVLRLKPGDRVTLFNGDGNQYPARLTGDPRKPCARIVAAESPLRESPLRITLLQALARGEKMDWIIQKATELGAARIVPIMTERSEVKLEVSRAGKRLEHWHAVAIAACEQCGRNAVPDIAAPIALDRYMARAPASESEACWMLQPGNATRVRDLGPMPATVMLAVGPEGGFGDADLAVLRKAGYRELTLGPRILRTETAGMAALAALQTWYGDF